MQAGPVVPLISSSVMGPIGVRHLPRLWLKLILAARRRLPEGYRSGIGGFDQAVCEALGVDPHAFAEHVQSSLPTYLECEEWILANSNRFDPRAIARFNALVVTKSLDPQRAADRRRLLGIDDDTARATALNDLDDWAAVHAALTRPETTPEG